MQRAIALAKRGFGQTSPNPLVGAVLVADGSVLGEGWHAVAGGPHAEVAAIADASCDLSHSTLYVTLEPCSTHGRTPPCVDAILRAGIPRVVIGATDPNPAHRGAGIRALADAGCDVRSGVLADDCHGLNGAFYCWIRHGRPLVLLKLAMTLDGKIATAGGDSKWVTGPAARNEVQRLRRWCDAIMVGGETVRQDDPQLLVRSPPDWPRQPLRLIASRANLPATAQVFCDGKAKTRQLQCENASDWQVLLQGLGAEGITALLVEGGGELAAELLRAGVVDQVALFVAPKLLGGRDARPAIGGTCPDFLADALEIANVRVESVGTDFLFRGELTDVHRPD